MDGVGWSVVLLAVPGENRNRLRINLSTGDELTILSAGCLSSVIGELDREKSLSLVSACGNDCLGDVAADSLMFGANNSDWGGVMVDTSVTNPSAGE